ncbi:MAG: hypothetical protein Q8Q09_03840 [Deltaproteobacteria bacterium]|nr:hypothetical protein [Deltaproteobacteria bacterium]
MKYGVSASLILVLAAQGCIVNQGLGGRDDGATGDSASVEDVAIRMDSLDGDGAVSEASTPVDAGSPADARVPADVADGGGGVQGNTNVRYVDMTVSTGHPIPALGAALTSVVVSLREVPGGAGSRVVRELARGGDCVFNEVAAGPQSMPTLDGATITATAAGRAPVALRRGNTGSTDNVLATYAIEFSPALAVGTTVRIDVGAIGTMPAFFREMVVSDAQYVAPSPVTDTPSARYVTRTAGMPLALAWTLTGGASTGVWVIPVITSGAIFELTCQPAAGATMTTVPVTVLDAASPYVPMSLGGASALLYVRRDAPEATLSNGTRVITRTGSSIVAGTRW